MRVAVTGCTSDFGTVILPRLFDDEDIEEVVGIDLREPRVSHEKLTFEREDVRSARIHELVNGCDVVVHLAYIVAEIHDKAATHSINIGGSRNVIEAAHAGGAKRLVIASSVASYGMHEDNPQPITEDVFPRGNHDKYYFYDKAEVEHFILWWKAQNAEAEMTITQLRPVVICGPHFGNGLLERGSGKTVFLPRGTTGFQWLHEADLADAFLRVIKEDHPGPFNVAPDDGPVPMGEIATRHGQKLIQVSPRVAAPMAEVLFRLRLSPASADWVGTGEVVADNSKLKRETGWQPRFSGREASVIHLLQRGRPLMQPTPELYRHEVAEAALETATRAVRQWADVDPGELFHDWIPFRTGDLHIEVHEAVGADATIVFSPGIGGHARFYTPVLASLRAAGFNVIGVDRPGHGLSGGRRGDAPMDTALDALEEVVRWARERFELPVALAGSSLGGITSWFALTREPDIACAVCHNISHPSMRIDRRAELTVPVIKRFAKVMPHAPIRIKEFADFGAVALDPRILRYFETEEDRLWNWTLSMRTGASFFSFEPQLPWERVKTPALVVVGEEDRMVSPDYTRQALQRATPPGAELRVLPGMGHMLYHEQREEMVELTAAFVREHTRATQGATTS